jgi:hypothetical protein
VARLGNRRDAYRVLVGRPDGKRSLGNLGVDSTIILNGSSRRGMGRHGLD